MDYIHIYTFTLSSINAIMLHLTDRGHIQVKGCRYIVYMLTLSPVKTPI